MSGVADDNFPGVQADPVPMGSRPASVLSWFHDAISVSTVAIALRCLWLEARSAACLWPSHLVFQVAFCYLSRQAGGSLWPSP